MNGFWWVGLLVVSSLVLAPLGAATATVEETEMEGLAPAPEEDPTADLAAWGNDTLPVRILLPFDVATILLLVPEPPSPEDGFKAPATAPAVPQSGTDPAPRDEEAADPQNDGDTPPSDEPAPAPQDEGPSDDAGRPESAPAAPILGLVNEALDPLPGVLPAAPSVPTLQAPSVPDLAPPTEAKQAPQEPATTHTSSAATQPFAVRSAADAVTTAAAAAAIGAVALAAVKITAPGAGWLVSLRRIVAAGLFSRLARSRVLDHATRQEIVEHLRATPGACVTQVQAAIGASLNTVTHHLRTLEAKGLVTSVKSGRRRCYFVVGDGRSPQVRLAAAALSTEASRRVFAAIEAVPGIPQQELAARLGITPTSIVFHTRRLEEAGVVRRERRGRVMAYYPALPAALAQS